MATVGKITAVLTATTKPFERGLKRARRATASFRSGVGAMAKKLVKFGAIAATAAVAGLAFMVRHQLKAIDSLGKLSRNIGVSVATLQAFHLAAGIAGIESDKFDKALKRMIKSVADAENGLQLQLRAFQALGVNIEDLKGKRPDEIFRIIADAVQRTGVSTERTAAIMDLFGTRVGADLVNLLAQGSAGLDETRQLMDDLGLSMTNVDVAQVEAANDAWLTFKTILDGVAKKFTVAIAPFLEHFTKKLIDAGREGGKMTGIIDKGMEIIASGIGFVKETLLNLEFGWLSLKGVALSVQLAIAKGLALLNSGFDDHVKTLEALITLNDQAVQANLSNPASADTAVAAFKRIREAARLAAEESLKIPKAMEVTSDALTAAARAMEKLKSAAARIFDATRTPMEKFKTEIEKLKELFEKGLINEDTFKRASEAAQKTLDGFAKKPAAEAEASRDGRFRQVSSLRHIALNGLGGSKAKPANAAKQEEANRVLEQIKMSLNQFLGAPTVRIAFD